ncbi:hypothetical protein [Xanthomonas sp. LMG 12460]|uniref:hypothetical protein n=1 Tax=Xanthomonas sp. LMG 12460 TaxID=1591132 RepID=UPI001D050FA9|nr:hypothetical protein [Xanthomonas sp. LMG 12460]
MHRHQRDGIAGQRQKDQRIEVGQGAKRGTRKQSRAPMHSRRDDGGNGTAEDDLSKGIHRPMLAAMRREARRGGSVRRDSPLASLEIVGAPIRGSIDRGTLSRGVRQQPVPRLKPLLQSSHTVSGRTVAG